MFFKILKFKKFGKLNFNIAGKYYIVVCICSNIFSLMKAILYILGIFLFSYGKPTTSWILDQAIFIEEFLKFVIYSRVCGYFKRYVLLSVTVISSNKIKDFGPLWRMVVLPNCWRIIGIGLYCINNPYCDF